jgi:hypothetical protein
LQEVCTKFTGKLAYFHADARAFKRVEGKRGKEIGRCRVVGAALLRAPSLMREQAGRKGADNDSLRLFCHHGFDRWAARTMELTGRMDARQCLAGWERRKIDKPVKQIDGLVVTKIRLLVTSKSLENQ